MSHVKSSNKATRKIDNCGKGFIKFIEEEMQLENKLAQKMFANQVSKDLKKW